MEPRVEILNEKKLVGKRLTMSLSDNKTGELWKIFMPRRKEITNNLTNDFISMAIYKPTYFADFKPTNDFEKWATVEVTDFEHAPTEMETFTLPAGLYAVFDYKGSSAVGLARIENLILFDRDAVVPHKQDTKRILNQKDSVNLPTLGIQAYSFAWGGETGGPWNRVLCFHRPSLNTFQCEFLYTGEYAMSLMGGQDNIIKSGAAHPLGAQLTAVGGALGDDVQMDKEKMKTLLVSVMEGLLGCSKVRSSFMDSLDLKSLPLGRVGDLNFKYSKNKKFLETIAKVKHEMTTRPDPYVVFFHGELINGIWKGTVRQYDDQGRFGIDLEYLNGDFAYTIWV